MSRPFPSFVLTVLLLFTADRGWAAETSPALGDFLETRFKQLDRDGDGRLSRDEAGHLPWFDRVDRDGDGFVTREEIRAVAHLLATRGIQGGGDLTPPDESPADTADESPRVGPKVLRAADAGVGRRVPDLEFADLDGQPGRLSDYATARALVIAFTSTSCPVTRKYAPGLARIEEEFSARGVAFLFVNPIATDSADDIRGVIRDHGLAGHYVPDKEGRLVAALGAKTTAEVLVLDAARTLVFRGAIDDQYGLGYALDAPRRTFLRDALTAVLAGNVPLIAATVAPGCALDLAPAAALAPLATDVTYYNRISRLVQNNCLECHRRGGVAPFSLATYEDVCSHAAMIRKQVSRGAMPPWFAAPPEAGAASHWSNDRTLAAADKADLLAWLGGSRPLGNPADAPLPRVFPEGWAIGKPDIVLQLPRAVTVKADGVMPYQVLRVDTQFAEDKWVQAYEIQPTSRQVVHHVIVRVHPKGTKAAVGAEGGAAGEREGFFAAYVPGNSHEIFPAGFGKKIPAGATVSFQLHYTPNGKATTDQTKLGLIFSAAPPRHVIRVTGLANGRLGIPPGAANHPETASLTLPVDASVLGFLPHMHLRGKAARYEVWRPDGSHETLLDVPRYDFNWQLRYQLAEPLTLPRGTRLVYTAWYDNSAGNPANPDPAKFVRWGPQTDDEMMLGYVEYFVPGRKAAGVAGQGDEE